MSANKSGMIAGKINIGGKRLEVKLSLILFEDGGNAVVYCPAVNVYGYGKTQAEAEQSFEVCFEEFLKYTFNKKTFASELEKLGWTIKKQRKFVPPSLSSLLDKNKTLHKIINTHDFTKQDRDFSLPAMC